MRKLAICGALLAGWLWAGAAVAEPVAMVTDVQGAASAMVSGKPVKLELLSYLEPGATLQLEPRAHLTITFFSRPVEYRFAGPARLKVETERVVSQDGKAEAHAVSLQKSSAAKKFTVAQRESVTQAAFEMRGLRAGLRLEDPVDTSLLDGDGLVFAWEGPRPREGYQLSVYGARDRLLQQVSLAGNTWTPPAGLLKAGESYAWEVRAALDSGEVLTARGSFSVAGADAAKAVREQAPRTGAAFSGRVLYAVFLEQQGFRYDARKLWRELSRERPDDVVAKEHSSR